MFQSFKNILVPVDFTINTQVAINKALELVDEGSVIHLLHVNKTRLNSKQQESKLAEWARSIEEYDENIGAQYWLKDSNSVQACIKETAEEIDADLIVIGQASSHYWLPMLKTVLPMRLAESTGIPVLTVKPGAMNNKAKTVVVPIGDEIPGIKISALELLCKKERLNIHLITFVDEKNIPSEFSASALLQVYQWLKSKLHCPVEYAVMHGSNKARAILQYAEKNNADILLVYPEMETKIGWWNKHISDVLPPTSKVQILAVQP